MNIPINFKPLVLSTCITLAACGGSSSNNDDIPQGNQSTTVSGIAQTPGGTIAHLNQQRPVMLAVLDFFIPSSFAAITGLTPVPNTTVELIRIDNDGNQIAVLDTTTTNDMGEYTLELPDGVESSADLVVQLRGDTTTLRAIVTGDSVDITPVSQFILDTLIDEPGVVLANLNLESVEELVNQVENLDIDLTGATTLEDAENSIEADSDVAQVLDDEVNAVASTALIHGAWGDDNLSMAVFYPGGFYINYNTNESEQDCSSGGIEYGSFSYDGTDLVISPTVDENGVCGFSDGGVQGTYQANVSNDGNTLNLISFDEEEQMPETASFPRVTDGDPDSIVGSWDVRSNNDTPIGIVFYSNDNYIMWQDTSDDANCTPGGVEYGTYSFDGSILSGNIVRDENSDCGLGEGPGSFQFDGVNDIVSVSNNQMTIEDDIETVVFDRVETSTAPEAGSGSDDTPNSSGDGDVITALNLTPNNSVTINKFVNGGDSFLPELLGDNSIQAQYSDGVTEVIDCWGHHYNADAGEHILHCESPSKSIPIYLGLSSNNTQVISFTYEDIGEYYMSYWVPEASGTTQITGTLPFDNSNVTITWDVNLTLE